MLPLSPAAAAGYTGCHDREDAVRDPYGVLGISRDATLDEIKRAFRGRAKELHPDANPTDADAAERFKDASAAYEILTDPEKRAHYMRGDWDPWRDGDWGGAHGRSDDIVFGDEFGPGDREADLFGDIAGRSASASRHASQIHVKIRLVLANFANSIRMPTSYSARHRTSF